MRDWNKYVREQLGDLRLRPEEEAEVIEEIAQHLESQYAESIASDSSP